MSHSALGHAGPTIGKPKSRSGDRMQDPQSDERSGNAGRVHGGVSGSLIEEVRPGFLFCNKTLTLQVLLGIARGDERAGSRCELDNRGERDRVLCVLRCKCSYLADGRLPRHRALWLRRRGSRSANRISDHSHRYAPMEPRRDDGDRTVLVDGAMA